MIKKDLILYGFIGVLVATGVYMIGVEYPAERQEQYNESKQVALNWNAVNATEADCSEMQGHLIKLATESFDGKQLIVDAIKSKAVEAGC